MKQLSTTLLLLASLALTACGGDDSTDTGNNNNTNGNQNTPPANGTLTSLEAKRELAFPGADGGASHITGAAGAAGTFADKKIPNYSVYVVSNLNDSGLGSLRNAVKASNGIVVFTVGGQINLKSKLEITGSNLTIAGQTAPGDGITIAGYPVSLSKATNVILRYLRFRMGDQNGKEDNFDPEDGDPLGGKDCTKVLIDHCSISWSTDECASFSRIEDFTLQYCIISESLLKSIHVKGNHGYGGIWGGRNASYHHNLLAHHENRTPRFDHSYVGGEYRGPIDYVNNVVYNRGGGNGCYGGETNSKDNIFHINMVNNYIKSGNNTTSKTRLLQLSSHCTNCVKGSGEAYAAQYYLDGNLIDGKAASWDNVITDGSAETRDKAAIKANAQLTSRWTTGLTPLSFQESADAAYETVLKYAGASLKRDAVDERIVNDVKNGTGYIINSVDETPGYPTLQSGTPIVDTDNDGMPDAWELEQLKALGVTGKTISDFKPNAYNITAKYTNLEVYINSLVVDTFPAGANASAIK